MIRFELSPQPCQPRVIESASHIRYPNIDCQSALAKLACKTFSVASATAFNTNLHPRSASTPHQLLSREKPPAKPAPQKTSAAAIQHTPNTQNAQVVPTSIRPSARQLPARTTPQSAPRAVGANSAHDQGAVDTHPSRPGSRRATASPSIAPSPPKKSGPPAGGPPMRPLGIEPRTY
jgi:hypothetical protein